MPDTRPQNQNYFQNLKNALQQSHKTGYFSNIKQKLSSVAHKKVPDLFQEAEQSGRLSITRDTGQRLQQVRDTLFPKPKSREQAFDMGMVPVGDTFIPMDMGLAGTVRKPATVLLKNAQSYEKEARSIVSSNLNSHALKIIKETLKHIDDNYMPDAETSAPKYLHSLQKAFSEATGRDIVGLTRTQTARLLGAIEGRIEDLDKRYKKLQIHNPFGADIK